MLLPPFPPSFPVYFSGACRSNFCTAWRAKCDQMVMPHRSVLSDVLDKTPSIVWPKRALHLVRHLGRLLVFGATENGRRDGKADTRQDGRTQPGIVCQVGAAAKWNKEPTPPRCEKWKASLKTEIFLPLPWDLRGMDGALVKPYLTNYDGVQITTEIMDEDQRAPAAASKWTFIISSCA